MTTSLKAFIRSIRSSKTLADERATIQRESASIRTSFKDTTISQTTRRINIQKLVYLYIIGEKTHFGQIECIKLLASSSFADKRLGYLASMLILDENQEILTLLTNSLNNDLNHPNQFIVALGLSTLGNIASYELSNDLYADVEKIINGNNIYLQKKALMVTSKLLEKNPDLSEIFLPKVYEFLNATDHGILITDLKLIRILYSFNPEFRSELILKSIDKIIEILKNLIDVSNLSHEYDVSSVNDPFLQVSLVKTLNLFFIDKDQVSITSKYIDQFQDLLTNVISYTNLKKSSGSSIPYEAIKTIFNMESSFDPSLRVLAINTLSSFLTHNASNNNNRYVALNSLLDVVKYEPLAVKRHRGTIIQCLNDLDMSIKRRALELSFAILDNSNIRILIKEILIFLENPLNNDKELKNFIIINLTNILSINELVPNEKWKFDTIIKFLKIVGNDLEFNEIIISKILALILNINDLELKTYTINKIFQISYNDEFKIGLSLINVYLVGEYGDLLINSKLDSDDKTSNKLITEDLLTDYLINLNDLDSNTLVSYLLTASLKFINKLIISNPSSKNINKLKSFIKSKESSIDLSIQLKSINFTNLINELNKNPKALSGILDRIPPPPIVVNNDTFTLTNRSKSLLNTGISGINHNDLKQKSNKTEDLLLDLMDDDINSNNIGGITQDSTQGKNNVDLLEDIFGSSSSKPSVLAPNSQKQDLLNLFGSGSGSNILNTPVDDGDKIFENSDLKAFLKLKSLQSGIAQIESNVINENFTNQINNFKILFAVPKTQKLTIINSNNLFNLNPNDKFKEELKIVGKEGTKLKLRIKINYSINGINKEEQFDYAFNKSL